MTDYRILDEYPQYLIYSDGRIYSKKKKKFVGTKYKNGYVCIRGTKTGVYAHRLVALAYPEICGEYEEGLQIDHINTIRDDNRAENLRWVTVHQNANNPITRQHWYETYGLSKKTPWNKGIPLTEECKMKKSLALKGRHWKLVDGIRVWY